MIKRINFNTLEEPLNAKSLISDQLNPYKTLLLKKKHKGVESVFKDVFPIKSNDGKFRLEYFKYRVSLPDCSSFDCIYKGTTYLTSIYIYIKFFKNNVLEQSGEVYLGNIPLMTKKGSFIVNGSERVIISQLNRSPGIFFSSTLSASGSKLFYLKIIPDKGIWVEIQINEKGILYANLDKKKKNKILITTLLRILGKTNTNFIIKNYYKVKCGLSVDRFKLEDNLYLLDNVIDFNYNIVAKKYTLVDFNVLSLLRGKGVSSINCIDVSEDSGIFLKTIKQDFLSGYEESLISFYKKIKPLESINIESAKLFVYKLFRDFKNYDLGLVGRHRLNNKLGVKVPHQFRNLLVDDVFNSVKYLVSLFSGKGNHSEDDIDDLSLKKVRTCGDLICGSFKVGLLKAEKILREKLLFYNVNVEFLNLQKLIYSKNITLTVRDFFNRSQLSQFMDQINPLAEITHKRRVTSLGPGGLSKDRAGFDVRDVHSSHYGKICPIETPEGPNIGLINSLSLYTCINNFGFLETPYQEVKKGVKTGRIVKLDSFKEKDFYIGQSNYLSGGSRIIVRKNHNLYEVSKESVDFVDLSPKQIISTATALIPFIEHNDANRALMGSNMQRQSVPLLINERPYVGSGLESQISKDSGNLVYSKYDCRVVYFDSNKVITSSYLNNGGVQLYRLLKFFRTNSSTCFNHRSVVKKNEFVSEGSYLVDGPSVDAGDLSLGKNILVAFMPWYGYNFEDAIIVSDLLLKKSIYTSIHINEFETVVQETKLGSEEITKEIPNLSRDSLKNLDGNGIVKIGSWVKPGDILVGKITPQGEANLAPEEKLIKAVFGEKSFNIKNSSMVLPPGMFGFIMNTQYSVSSSVTSDFEPKSTEQAPQSVKSKKLKQGSLKDTSCNLQENLIKVLSNILLGEKLPLRVFNKDTNETIIPSNKKITKTLLRKLSVNYKVIDINPSPIRIKIMSIVDGHKKNLNNLDLSNIKSKRRGEGLDQGLNSKKIKSVKIFVAIKKNIQVGDKMSGRHGNKGVVSKIIAECDMPFLNNGVSVQMILNPLGVPSRMNVGQVLETHTGLVCSKLGVWVTTPPFNGLNEYKIQEYLYKSKSSVLGKMLLRNGYTGNLFDSKVVVGYMYIMKLNHLVSSKIHSRAVGPYSLITQQPLGGKSQYGGQRFGEMEVWALEAYGSAYTLQELLTVKSDDVQGRATIYESIVKGNNRLQAGMPQSFNVLMKELQGLCLDIKLNKY